MGKTQPNPFVTTRLQKIITDYEKRSQLIRSQISGLKGTINKAKIRNADTAEFERKVAGMQEVDRVRTMKSKMLRSMLEASWTGGDVEVRVETIVTFNGVQVILNSEEDF